LSKQSKTPFEVIVVQNGSFIGYEGFARLKGIIFLKTSRALSPGEAANLGAARAKGDYFAFHEDDDFWHRDYLTETSQRIQECGDQLYASKLVMLAPDGTVIREKTIPGGKKQRSVFHSNPGFTGHNIVVSRSLFEKLGGFSHSIRSSQGRDFLVRSISCGVFATPINRAVAFKNSHPGPQVSDTFLPSNRQFFAAHWRKMTTAEMARSMSVLGKRHLFSYLGLPQDFVMRLRRSTK